MKDYTFKEIGMLVGAGIGGAITVVGYYIWSNLLFSAFAIIGIALGITIGNKMDRRNSANSSNKEFFDL